MKKAKAKSASPRNANAIDEYIGSERFGRVIVFEHVSLLSSAPSRVHLGGGY
jgi:hypothetical protein